MSFETSINRLYYQAMLSLMARENLVSVVDIPEEEPPKEESVFFFGELPEYDAMRSFTAIGFLEPFGDPFAGTLFDQNAFWPERCYAERAMVSSFSSYGPCHHRRWERTRSHRHR